MPILGLVLDGLSVATMYGFQLHWYFLWWGPLGVLLAFLVPPLCLIFPFVYLLKEGFSLFYFEVSLVGIVGMSIAFGIVALIDPPKT